MCGPPTQVWSFAAARARCSKPSAKPPWIAGHPRPRTLPDLERHELLLVPVAADFVARLRTKDGRRLRLRTRFRVNDLFAVRELAEAGAGIAVLPDYVASDALATGTLVRLLPRTALATLPIHAVYPGRRHLPRHVAVVLDALAAAWRPGGNRIDRGSFTT